MQNFLDKIKYSFKDEKNLLNALTHPSAKKKETVNHYERYEFLGDAILKFAIAKMLFAKYKTESEGSLSKRLSFLVSRDMCYQIGLEIKIGDVMILSRGEEQNGGRQLSTNLANAVEALIGAIYLDGGIDHALAFIGKLWKSAILSTDSLASDAKTKLQEWSQAKYKTTPIYNLKSQSGPEHNASFAIEVVIANIPSQIGTGKTKKDAEKNAAEKMLELIHRLQLS